MRLPPELKATLMQEHVTQCPSMILGAVINNASTLNNQIIKLAEIIHSYFFNP